MTSRTAESAKIKRKNAKSYRRLPIVDTTQASSNLEVVRMCIKQLGWKEYASGWSTNVDIYWNAATFQQGDRNYATISARVNKFPGMSDILQKANLTRSLNVMQMLFPDEYDFYPKTWFLPEQREQFQNDAHSIHKKDRQRRRPLTTFIVKPSDGSEGAGIYLIQDRNRCNFANRPYIVQEYIDRPLLINGLKFDIRIYALILQLDPLKIFLYDEGLARFATVDYQAPSMRNLHEAFMHLTNYSLNKRSATYKHASDEQQTDASKRKLSLVWSQLRRMFSPSEIEQAKETIKDIINKTVLAILPDLRVQYAMELPKSRKQNQCFHIIGFDIILTDELKPMLLEVNANPSLRIDFDHFNEAGKFVREASPIDEEIKKPLVLETLQLVMKYRRNHKQLKANDKITTQQDNENSSNDDDNENDEEIENRPVTLVVTDNNFSESTVDKSTIIRSPTSDSTKSLKLIFPSTSSTNYEPMFLVEKLAFIYIELVIKRGYKSMTNWPFRHFAKRMAFLHLFAMNQFELCGILDQATAMSSIDILYTQIFHKCKQSDLESPATGLHFPAFMEAFFLLAQRKYPTSPSLFDTITELTNCCLPHLNFFTEEESA